MQINTYENLKSSGSTWLGDIPTHWNTKKLKFLATVQPSNVDKKTVEGEEPVILCNYTDVYKNDYIDSRLEFMQASATEAEIKKFKVDIGDVIVTKDSETPDDIAVPACIAEEVEGLVCGYHLTQIKPIDLHGRYLFRLFQSKGFNAQFVVSANGVTRFGLPQHAIANAFTPIPPLEEQQAIARFLDFKTAQIDALIAKKKSLLDKLAEKRTALISHAVTKGLDPSLPMKDSGVAWLGDIPAHWKPIKLKRVAHKIIDGAHFTPTYVSEGIPFLRVTDIVQAKGGPIDCNEIKYIPEQEHLDLIKRCKPEKGDLLYSKNGTIGIPRVVDWDFEFSIFVSLCLIKMDREVLLPYFLQYVLLGRLTQSQIALGAKSNTVTNLHLDKIQEFWLTLPPIPEQDKIVSHLDRITQKINKNIESVETAIDRLQEYRSALITNAVTGKIDVRDFAIPQIAEGFAS